ncbi:MAG: peptidylprolyl isomerase [Candidatus Limnocylindrus sp.]|jgi:cyclophilin family peptidyl-prolyl cis-trans isomerase
MRRSLLAAAVALLILFAIAACDSQQDVGKKPGCPSEQPAALTNHEEFDIEMRTSMGKITLHLAADNSPIAVGNFVALASCGFYDDVIFHRIATMQDGTPFVIQGGDPLGTGKGGPGYLIDDEPVIGTYRRGTVAMARTSEPNSQGSQFFIVLSDAAAGPLEQARTYAILGEVSAGMDTVDAISQVPLAGGTQPIDPVVIESVSVTRTTP